MMTNCERCTKEIDDDDVTSCEECGLDGICEECAGDHECDGDEEHNEDEEDA